MDGRTRLLLVLCEGPAQDAALWIFAQAGLSGAKEEAEEESQEKQKGQNGQETEEGQDGRRGRDWVGIDAGIEGRHGGVSRGSLDRPKSFQSSVKKSKKGGAR